MKTDRRSFLRLSTMAGGALALGGFESASATALPLTYRGLPDVPAAPRPLDILILGGTGFTGPFQVEYALARGHRITVFNRGRSERELHPSVVQLTGDRNLHQLEELRGKSWDIVIDNPTTLPFWVRDVGEVLKYDTGQYLFISTISAYEARSAAPIDEDSPTLDHEGDPLAVTQAVYQEQTGSLYGPMKAASEREARRWFGDRTTGVFNATGPRSRLSMAEQVYGIRSAFPGDTEIRFTWVPPEFLDEQEVRPWMEMTTWFGEDDVLSSVSVERAVGAGLTYRPLSVTAVDTLEWFRTLPAERQAQPRSGLAPEKEATALSAWHARGG